MHMGGAHGDFRAVKGLGDKRVKQIRAMAGLLDAFVVVENDLTEWSLRGKKTCICSSRPGM